MAPGLGLLHCARHLSQALPAARPPAIARAAALLPALGLPAGGRASACVAYAAPYYTISGPQKAGKIGVTITAFAAMQASEMLSAPGRAWQRCSAAGELAQVQRAQAGQLRDEAHEAHVAAADARAHVAALAAATGLGHLRQARKPLRSDGAARVRMHGAPHAWCSACMARRMHAGRLHASGGLSSATSLATRHALAWWGRNGRSRMKAQHCSHSGNQTWDGARRLRWSLVTPPGAGWPTGSGAAGAA